jgi:hypothetical protein
MSSCGNVKYASEERRAAAGLKSHQQQDFGAKHQGRISLDYI